MSVEFWLIVVGAVCEFAGVGLLAADVWRGAYHAKRRTRLTWLHGRARWLLENMPGPPDPAPEERAKLSAVTAESEVLELRIRAALTSPPGLFVRSRCGRED